jgi:hypothetical protein
MQRSLFDTKSQTFLEFIQSFTNIYLGLKFNILTLVTWWLISVGPGGSSQEMLLASVASACASHQSRKSVKRVQA